MARGRRSIGSPRAHCLFLALAFACMTGGAAAQELRMQTSFSPSSPMRSHAVALGKRIGATVFNAGELAPVTGMLPAVASGEPFQAAWTHGAYSDAVDPGFAALDAVPRGAEAADYVRWRDGPAEALASSLYRPRGVVGMLCGVVPGAGGLWTRQPLPATGIRGLRWRVIGRHVAETLSDLGAIAVTVPLPEAGSMLAHGQLDVVVGLNPADDARVLAPMARYYYPDALHPVRGIDLVINAKTWDGLDRARRQEITQACRQTVQDMQAQLPRQFRQALASLKAQGVEVRPLPEALARALRQSGERTAVKLGAGSLARDIVVSAYAVAAGMAVAAQTPLAAPAPPGPNGPLPVQPGSAERRGARLGITVENVSRDLAERRGMAKADSGLLVTRVEPGGPAARAGMREGDIIVRFANADILGQGDLADKVAASKPGSTVEVEVHRLAGSQILRVVPEAPPVMASRPEGAVHQPREIDPEIADMFARFLNRGNASGTTPPAAAVPPAPPSASRAPSRPAAPPAPPAFRFTPFTFKPPPAQTGPANRLGAEQRTLLRETATTLLERNVVTWFADMLVAMEPPNPQPNVVIFEHELEAKRMSSLSKVAVELVGSGEYALGLQAFARAGVERGLDDPQVSRLARLYARFLGDALLRGLAIYPAGSDEGRRLLARLESRLAGDSDFQRAMSERRASQQKYPPKPHVEHDHCGSSRGLVMDELAIRYVGLAGPGPEDHKDIDGKPNRVVTYDEAARALAAAARQPPVERDALMLGIVGTCVVWQSVVERGDIPAALTQLATTIQLVTRNSHTAAQSARLAMGTRADSWERDRAEDLRGSVSQQANNVIELLALLKRGLP